MRPSHGGQKDTLQIGEIQMVGKGQAGMFLGDAAHH